MNSFTNLNNISSATDWIGEGRSKLKLITKPRMTAAGLRKKTQNDHHLSESRWFPSENNLHMQFLPCWVGIHQPPGLLISFKILRIKRQQLAGHQFPHKRRIRRFLRCKTHERKPLWKREKMLKKNIPMQDNQDIANTERKKNRISKSDQINQSMTRFNCMVSEPSPTHETIGKLEKYTQRGHTDVLRTLSFG